MNCGTANYYTYERFTHHCHQESIFKNFRRLPLTGNSHRQLITEPLLCIVKKLLQASSVNPSAPVCEA